MSSHILKIAISPCLSQKRISNFMKKVSEVLHYTEKQQKASLSKIMPLAMEVRFLHVVPSCVCVAFFSTKLNFLFGEAGYSSKD